jgi:phosphatidate cytidylyltransferase
MGAIFGLGWYEIWTVSEVTAGPIREKCWALLTLVLFAALSVINLRQHYGPNPTIFLFATLWASDTTAYLVGRRFKDGYKFSKVSPNKTLAGLIAGFTAALCVANIAHVVLPRVEALVICLTAGALAPVGDLLFSSFKRECDVKDFSTVLPGHGGILDRFDSLTFSSIGVYLFLSLIH